MWAACLALAAAAGAPLSAQQTPLRKIYEMDLAIRSVAATVEPTLVLPKATHGGIRVTLRTGSRELSIADAARMFGADVRLEGELSGPGLPQTLTLPKPLQPGEPPIPGDDDPLLLRLPPLPTAGDYSLANLRLVSGGRTVLDVTPRQVGIQVIDEILITSVKTRPLTLDEIRQKGIVLDSDDYLGFEFTLAMKLESTPVNVSFPVVFDRQNIPVPELLRPPSVSREGVPLPTMVPVLLEPELEGDGGVGEKIPLTFEELAQARIPGILVIPGNVGYLKQFFSAQLFVANGAPSGSRLTVHDVTGTIALPKGDDDEHGTGDDPLALAETATGIHATLPVSALGPDGQSGTGDDIDTLNPGEQGQAEFLIRGDREGFHEIKFDIRARLEGLAVGPITLKGSASGGVLVRNAYYDITFAAPAVVRDGERFTLYATVTNIGQGIGNHVQLTIDAARMANMRLVDAGKGTQTIDTLMPGDAATLEYEFISEQTGQVVASYIRFDTTDGSTGRLNFYTAIGDRGVPLSPDTLVLPAVVDRLPDNVLRAAMRVLGQAWSAATAPPGTLPSTVTRPSKDLVLKKAQAVAEAGLRMTLGQPLDGALRDLTFDLYGGAGVPGQAASLQTRVDRGFDQAIRETNAGYALAQALGAALVPGVSNGGPLAFERDLAQVAASGPDFISIAVTTASGDAADLSITSVNGQRSVLARKDNERPETAVPGLVFLPLGPVPAAQTLALIATTSAAPYTLELTGRATTPITLSVTLPRGDGTFTRGEIAGVTLPAQGRARLVIDPTYPDALVLQVDANGDGTAVTGHPLVASAILPQGPSLVSANVVGPETLDNAAPFGQHVVLVFDRLVDAGAAAKVNAYTVPKNAIAGAQSVLSGRLVVLSLEQPEGKFLPATLAVSGLTDLRGVPGSGGPPVPLGVRLDDAGAIVSGRVLEADGTPVTGGFIYYRNNKSLIECKLPDTGLPAIAKLALDADGRFEFRYVRRDVNCGFPFEITTVDPGTNGVVGTSRFVRADGEHINVDLVLFGRGSVTGTVKDTNGNGVGGADVVVLSGTDSQIGGKTKTDGDGHYTVGGITVGPVSVRAVKGPSLGYAAGRIDRAGTTTTIDVSMDGGAVTVSGTVLRRDGASTVPLPGAYVGYHAGSANGPVVGVARTNEDGFYEITGMPTGAYVLEATSEGYRAYRNGIAAAGDDIKDQHLLIERPGVDNFGTVRGTVRYPSGAAGADAYVVVDGTNRGVLTGAPGTFEVPVPVGSPVTIRATLRNGKRSGSTTVELETAGDELNDIAITLSGLARAIVTVVEPDGVTPVPNVLVRRLDCSDVCGCAGGTTNGDGLATLEGLRLGTTRLQVIRAAGEGFDVATGVVYLSSDDQTVTTTLRFNGQGTVLGIVKDADGHLLHGADIELTSMRFVNDGAMCGLTPMVSHRLRTDTNGAFVITGVNVGPLEVFASHFSAPQRVGQKGALTGAGRQAEFELRLIDTMAGELSGVVRLPDNETRAGAGVEVTVNGMLPDVTVRTDETGKFVFAKVLPKGPYTLTARDPITGGLAEKRIELHTGQDATHDLRLKGRGTVRVTVVDAADRQVSSAFVKLTEVDFPRRAYERTIEAAHQGVATFERIFEGPIALEASDAFGRGGRLSTAVPGPDTVVEAKIRLGIVGKVHGRFFVPDPVNGPQPVAFGVVKLLSNSRVIGQATTSEDDPTTTDEDETGEFSFDYVPAGPFRLEAQHPYSARTGVGAGTITTQDEDVLVDIVAQELGTVTGTALSNTVAQKNARVSIQSGQFTADTIADNNGRYIFTGVPEGRVIVTASLDGSFLRGTAEGTLAGEAQTLTLDVPLHDSGSVEGQVTTSAGVVAPHVLVAASVTGSGGDKQSTTADAEGRFRFQRMPTGNVTVDVELPGSIDRGRATVDVLADQAVNVPVRLNGTGALKVLAFDKDNLATAGYVEIKGTGAFPYTRGFDIGDTGVLTIPELLAGPITVTLRTRAGTFTHYGTNTGTVTANQLPNQPSTIEVHVGSTGTVRGIVMLADGVRPAVGAIVTVTVQNVAGILSGVTKGDGSFELNGVPYGSLSVRVDDPQTKGVGVKHGLTLSEADDDEDAGTIVLDNSTISVVSVDPPNETTGVPASQVVRLTFSDPIASTNGISVWNGTVQLNPSIQPAADYRAVTITHTWPSESRIEVRVSTDLTDIYGRHPVAAFASWFETVDSAGPRVETISPADRTIEVDPAAVTVVVTFNEELKLTGYDSVVTLSGPNGLIAGTSELTGRVITFRPAYALQANARYTVRAIGARDRHDNVQTLAAAATFSTTDTTPPEISLSSPSHGSKTTNRRPRISFVMEEEVTSLDPASATMTITTTAGTQQVQPEFANSSLSFTPLEDLPLGTVTVTASIADVTNHRATATGSFTVQVEPIGGLTGRLFMADGQTPAAGYAVRVVSVSWSTTGPQRITNGDGTFTFETLDARSYYVIALNADGKVRADERVTVVPDAMTPVDMQLAPEGRVAGQVLRPNGTPAADVSVSVQSHHAEYNNSYSVTTNASGAYAVERMPTGNVTVTVNDTKTLQRGEATGTVAADQTATINVQLVADAIALPHRLYDGNNYNLNIQRNGSGSSDEFVLELVRDGATTGFEGAANGSREDSNREVAIRQANVAGLDVTRKMFVPSAGYFYRYLELLTNPGTTPVTVTVRVSTAMASSSGSPRVITSSSGEDLLDVSDPTTADRWVTLDDNADAETGVMATALVFDGEGGADAADDAEWVATSPRRAIVEWRDITILPGQTAAVMHLGARLASRVGAQYAAERLVQLPPETLTGLSAAEKASIRNFAVPAEGSGPVPALPAVDGKITGTTYAGNGTTAVGSSRVWFRSQHPLFGRTFEVSSNSSGVYTFTPDLVTNGGKLLIPIANFVITAEHAVTRAPATSAVTSFPAPPPPPAQHTATANVVFIGTGQIEGVVRWRTGAVANGADVSVPKPGGGNWTFRADATGRYFGTGIPVGTYTITAYGKNGHGRDVPGTATVTVTDGVTTQTDITLVAVGGLTGRMRRADGTVLTGHGTYIQLVAQSDSNIYYYTYANSGTGQYTFSNVPTGLYWLQASDPVTSVQARVPVTIDENLITPQDLTFIATGTVTLQVYRANGAPATDIHVAINESARGNNRGIGYVDGNGRMTITNIALGTFVITAQAGGDSRFPASVSGRIDSHGQTVSLSVTMPPYGRITGRVTRVTGQPVPSNWVGGYRANNSSVSNWTNNDGYYTLERVWGNEPIRVHSSSGQEIRDVMTSVVDGETKEVNLVLSGLATVRVTVRGANGTPIASTSVWGRDGFAALGSRSTNSSGVVIFSNVREGEAVFVATSLHARVTRTIVPGDHGQTIDLTITEPPLGALTGTVFAADGVTPVRGATIYVRDADTDDYWYSAATNSTTGVYHIPNVRGDKLRVRAHAPHDTNVTAERIAAIQSAGATEVVDLTLPVSVIHGRVYFGDGITPVPSPSVFVTQPGTGGTLKTFDENWSGPDGRFVVIGPAVGAFTIMAQDTPSALTGESAGTVAQIETPVPLDITLQQSGTVTGVLRNPQGAPTNSLIVAISASGVDVTRKVWPASGTGRFTFTRVPLGTSLLHAQSFSSIGGAHATLTTQDETANVDVTYAAVGTVNGIVLAADGVTPVAGATVRVYPVGPHGAQGFETSNATTNASGRYTATNVPLGAVRVAATNNAPNWHAGVVDSVLTAAGPLEAPALVLNNARWMVNTQLLNDAGGFRWDFDCKGQVVDGSNGAYDYGLTLTVSGVDFPCTPGATTSSDGRTIGFGPLSFSHAVRVTRDVFVPADASFVRYVESFTNDTAAPITLRVQTGWTLGANYTNKVIVPPDATGGTYAVTDNSADDGTATPALGHVFAGAGAAVMPAARFVGAGWKPTVRWPLTIAPGQTVSVLHFEVQRTLRADAQAQAEALANLTDPVALIGLTPAQRASIVNFVVP